MQSRRYFADQYEGNPTPLMGDYAAAGHVLYACKASEGISHIDASHAHRAREAHDRGLTVLHYHFCRPEDLNPAIEADLFWYVVKPTYVKGDYLALDFEVGADTRGADGLALYIEKLHSKVQDITDHDAVIYGSTSFLNENTVHGWLRKRRVWVADYDDKPTWPAGIWHPWAWQMTDGKTGPRPHALAGIGNGDVSLLNFRTSIALSVRARRRRRAIQHK